MLWVVLKKNLLLGVKFFLETYRLLDKINLELVVFTFTDEENTYVFKCQGKTNAECVEAFEKAKIFDGLTIYEAENEIEVIFG
jgi:hypothetical protein